MCDHCSVNAPIAVGFRPLFPLFCLVPVLQLLYLHPGGILRLHKAKNSLLLQPGEEFCPDHLLLGRRRVHNNKVGI